MLADHPEKRRAQHLEERAVIVKKVPVLQIPVRPAPDDVEVLRLIRVHPVDERVKNMQRDDRRHAQRHGPRFRDAYSPTDALCAFTGTGVCIGIGGG